MALKDRKRKISLEIKAKIRKLAKEEGLSDRILSVRFNISKDAVFKARHEEDK